MAKKTRKTSLWLGRLWEGFLHIITAPFVAVARLVERVVMGKEGVKKAEENAKRKEQDDQTEKDKIIHCETEETAIKELIEERDKTVESPWGDDTIESVKVNPSKVPGMKYAYSITCKDGQKYVMFINEQGALVRNSTCPSTIAFQMKQLLEQAAFDKNAELDEDDLNIPDEASKGDPVQSPDEPESKSEPAVEESEYEEPKNPFVGAIVSIRGQEGVRGFCSGEFFLDDRDQYMPYITFYNGGENNVDIKDFTADDIIFEDEGLQRLYSWTREIEEAKEPAPSEPQNPPVSKEDPESTPIPQGSQKSTTGLFSQSYSFPDRGFVVTVAIDENGKGTCVCEKGDTKLSLSAEVRDTGVVVVTGEPSVITEAKRMSVLADMKKSIADAYAKQERPLDGGFIEDVRILAKKVIESQDKNTVAFVCKNTIFSPEISDKEMKVSSQYSIGKKNKPEPVRLGERWSVSEINREIVKAFATVEGAIRGKAVPKDMIFRTENEAFAVLEYDGKPDAVSLTYDEKTGSVVIEGDRVLQYSEIRSVCDKMGDKTNLSPFRQNDIYGAEEKAFVANSLDPATNGEQWCVSQGLLACVKQDNGEATLELRVMTGDGNPLIAEVPLPDGVDLSSAVDTGIHQIVNERLEQMAKGYDEMTNDAFAEAAKACNEDPYPPEQIN